MRFKNTTSVLACLLCVFVLSACSETRYAAHVAKQIPMRQDQTAKTAGTFKVGNPYKILGRRYQPSETYNHTETGTASWYGPGFHGKKTANGEIFDKYELTAAHRTLQLPSIVKVTNLNNGRSAILRVNDRGPFAHNRILDVSERAATVLGFKNKGTARIRLEVVADASREVAAIAKTGRSTRGYEIALNQPTTRRRVVASGAVVPPRMPPSRVTEVALNQPATRVATSGAVVPPRMPVSRLEPVTEVVLSGQPSTASAQTASVAKVQAEPLDNTIKVASNSSQGNFSNTGKVFVQAGSFSQEANALKYSNELAKFGPSRVYLTRVNNQPYFRVRLGPYDNRTQAQQTMTALNESGNQNAVIVAE